MGVSDSSTNQKGLFDTVDLVYITYYDVDDDTSGINRKIRNQINTFSKYGINVKVVQVLFNTEIKFYKLIYRLPFTNISPTWKYTDQLKGADYIYLRRPFFMNWSFLRFLKKVKSKTNAKVLLEIPTYPYDKEILSSIRNYPLYLKEILARRSVHKWVDKIITLTNDDNIFGVDTLKISNGYDYTNIKYEPRKKKMDDVLDLFCVANFHDWHGYDRLLKSYSTFKKHGHTEKVMFHLIGDGPELEKYHRLVITEDIQESVKFYGSLNSQQLKELYPICDVGVGALGCFRKDIRYIRDLKSREYMAYGLPIITTSGNDVLEIEDSQIHKYILEIPNDNTIPDFSSIYSFYESLKADSFDYGSYIREVGEKQFSMEKAMLPVLDYLQQKN